MRSKINIRVENLVLCNSVRDHLDTYHKDDLVNPPTHHNGRKPIKLGKMKRDANGVLIVRAGS